MTVADRLRNVFQSVLGVDGASLSDEDSPQTVPEWDSLSHLTLVMAVEAEFGFTFDIGEIPALTSVGSILRRIEDGTGAARVW